MHDLSIVGATARSHAGAVAAVRRIAPGISPLNNHVVGDDGGALWVRPPGHIHTIGQTIPVAFVGRLDNRDDVCAALGHGDDLSDAALAAAAWERWGDGALPRLIGGFVLAVWDATTAEMVLAVDATGEETVYTASLFGCFTFASHPRVLRPYLEGDGGTADLECMALWMWERDLPPERTPFRGIDRIPPGQLWRISRSGIRKQTYWRPGDAPPIRFRREQDYVDAAREVLDRVVGCHLPAGGRLAADLTGGLDTTAIVTAAARLAPHLTIDCFTTVSESGAPIPYEIPGHSGDEWPAVLATASAYPNLRPHRIEAGGLAPEEIDPVSQFDVSPMGIGNSSSVGWGHSRKTALSRLAPCRILSGVGGNLTFSRDGFDLLPSLFRNGRWLSLGREIHALMEKDGRPWRWYLLGRAVYPGLPSSLRRKIRQLRGHDLHQWSDMNLIRPEAVARYGLANSTAAKGWTRPFEGRTDREGLVREISKVLTFWHKNRAPFHALGLDVRAPLLDRRMIDFCLAIPADQFLQNGVTRSLARRVLAGRVPDNVRMRPRTYLSCPEWHHRMTRARPYWMAAIEGLEASAAVNELLDMPKLRRLAESWPDIPTRDQELRYASILQIAINTGRFIRWANREN
ncbi:asparagine synthetase B family protein [Niveispirillum sp.]|uniref:asparagine synthase-related protein n=1 Tax=Niveispirillum sp. TaxID=1917217 RepID=UPI001B51094F|nr:asparagine synthetase B family protein [Niveispirillum sp.]MBP7336171.1 hypothetical protein [Niveispirillum sp.]